MTIKAPNPGIRVTVERFYGSTRLLGHVDIHCSDRREVDHIADLVIGTVQAEKRSAESKVTEGTSNAGD